MAQFKNNQFTSDNHDEHTLRMGMCIAGMDTYSEDIEFRGELPVKMAEHLDNWKDLRSGLSDEWGEQKGARTVDEEKEFHRLFFFDLRHFCLAQSVFTN